MSEEVVKTDEGISTDKANENEATVDKAELERLKAADERLVELDKYATEAGMENAEEYQSTLEDMAYDKKLAEDKKAAVIEPKKVEKTDDSKTDDSAALFESFNKKINDGNLASLQAVLEAQWTAWIVAQAEVPVEQRSKATRTELTKLVRGAESPVITSIAQKKFEGNVFAAANYVNRLNQGTEEARKEGADSATALANAANSADLPTGGKTAIPSNLTADEKVAARQKELADDIAADTPYVMPK